MNKRLIFVAAMLLNTLAGGSLFAEEDSKDSKVAFRGSPGFPYQRGVKEVQGMAGAFVNAFSAGGKHSNLTYQLESVRLGWMYDDVRFSGLLRGNNEFLVELFGGPVINGGGSVLAGASLMWRYNFVQPEAKLIPYFQLGAGGLYNDIYTSNSQRQVGQAFEFILQAGIGARYMLSEKWAISLEAGYRHISNAGLGSRNLGLNSLGGLVGVSYFF